MKSIFLSSILALAVLLSCNRKLSADKTFERSAYVAQDHTAENLFTNNIEGPAFDSKGRLFVVNFQQDGTIGLVQDNGKVSLFTTLPGKSIGNSIQFNAAGNMLIADFAAHNVLELNPATKQASVYAHDSRFNQPNDICISTKGIVFASDPDWKNQTGQIWKIGLDRKPVLLKSGMGTTNGICLSPDEKTLYVNESVQKRIWAFDVNESGDISNQRIFAVVDDFGYDGMKTTPDGHLFVCRWGKGTVQELDTNGQTVREINLKGKQVSNIVFGGKDKKTAFVTLQDRKCMEKFRIQ
jgi:gluconolactonase